MYGRERVLILTRSVSEGIGAELLRVQGIAPSLTLRVSMLMNRVQGIAPSLTLRVSMLMNRVQGIAPSLTLRVSMLMSANHSGDDATVSPRRRISAPGIGSLVQPPQLAHRAIPPDPMTEYRSLETFAIRSVIAVAIAVWLAPGAGAADFAVRAQGFFAEHCVACHDADTKKAGLDLTALPWKPNDPSTFDRWVEVFDKVDKQKMPPAQKARPDPAVRAEFLGALRAELSAANRDKQRTEGRVVLRRLNRVEYENTLHDLLSIDVPLQHYLPEDTAANGFDNVAQGLRLSMLHMEQYLEAADAAISAAMALGRQPEVMHKRLRYQDEESIQEDVKKKEKKTFRVLPDAVVIFDDNSPTALRQWIVQTRGRYRIRISAYAYQAAGRPVWLKLYCTDWKTQRLHGYFDFPADQPREVEVVTTLEAGRLLNLSPFDTNYDDQGRRSGFWGIGAETYAGRGIAIKWVEVEGPLARAMATAVRRPIVRRSARQRNQAGSVRPPGPGLCDCARRPAIGGREGVAGIRDARVPAPGHVGRRRALRQISVPGARPGAGLRGRPARGLPRRDHVTKVPVS